MRYDRVCNANAHISRVIGVLQLIYYSHKDCFDD